MGQDVQAREDPESETEEKKLKNSQKPGKNRKVESLEKAPRKTLKSPIDP